jgi:hypothetical protein
MDRLMMDRSIIFIPRVLSILLALALVSTPARALESACKPVFDTLGLMAATPTHVYTTETAAFHAGGKPTSSEAIYVGGAVYVKVNGKWIRSAITPEEMLQQEPETQQKSKATCRYLHQEWTNGEAANVYSMHSDTEDAKLNVQLWISRKKHLPLREELDINIGGTMGKSHRSTRYEYGNIQPPQM